MDNMTVWKSNNLSATELCRQTLMMTWCLCVCESEWVCVRMCVPGLRRRVLSRKQWIPCPFDFLSFSPTLSHTNSLCLSLSLKGNSQEMVMLVIKCVNTQKHRHAFCLSIFHRLFPFTGYFPLKSTSELWRINMRESRDVAQVSENSWNAELIKELCSGTGCQRCSIAKHAYCHQVKDEQAVVQWVVTK